MFKKLLLALLLVAPSAWAQTSYESFVTTQSAPQIFYYGTESSGTIVNHGSSGSGYNLTAGTAPTYAQSGVSALRGTSLLFTSASSQFMHANANDTGGGPGDVGGSGQRRTFECWAKISTTTGAMMSTGKAESGSSTDRVWQIGQVNTPAANFLIFDDSGSTLYSSVTGATTLTSGNWYLITGTWNITTTTNILYVNGVQDGTKTTIGGSGVTNAVSFWAMGRREGDDAAYFQGNIQDCMVKTTDQAAATILARYNFGVSPGVGGWPFLTKRPSIPHIRNDDYIAKVMDRGYMTGHFTNKAVQPQWLTVGWLPFSVLPPGDVR